MILTVVFPPPAAGAEPLCWATSLAQADRLRASAVVAMRVRGTLRNMGRAPSRGYGGSQVRGAGELRGPPAQQPLLQQRDEPLGGQRDDRDDEHPGVHTAGVEGALRGLDEQAQPVL